MKTPLAFLCLLLVGSASLRAEEVRGYYGVVEVFGEHELVVRTTQHSTGHWEFDRTTRIEGHVYTGDWVYLDVGVSGHVHLVRTEEHPSSHTGVIAEIRGPVLHVRSGMGVEKWNVVETTVDVGDVRLHDLAPGDEVSVKVYRNHNVAEIRVLRRGVPLR